MISDEQMDARLAEAGEQWRAVNTGAYAREDVATETIAVTESGPFRSRWTLLISAAAVVALLTGGGLWFANRPTSHGGAPAGPGTVKTNPSPAHDGGLLGKTWLISSATHGSGEMNAGDSTATLHIAADGTVTGSDGCNPISGKATFNSYAITFGPLAIGAIGCYDTAVTKIASTIDAMLSGAITWDIQTDLPGYDLILEKTGVGQLVYNWQPAVAPPVEAAGKMAGTWELSETDHTSADGNSGGASGSSDDVSQILAITADGTFKVQHRCYANSGTAKIGKGTADFGKTHLDGSTPCPSLDPTEMKDEQTRDSLIDKVLSDRTTWKIENGQLRITKGEDTLVYQPFRSSDTTATSTP